MWVYAHTLNYVYATMHKTQLQLVKINDNKTTKIIKITKNYKHNKAVR